MWTKERIQKIDLDAVPVGLDCLENYLFDTKIQYFCLENWLVLLEEVKQLAFEMKKNLFSLHFCTISDWKAFLAK